MAWELALPLTAAGAAAAWAQLAAWRAGHGRAAFTIRALLGGAAAFGLALCAYDSAALFGAAVRWESVAGGGVPAILAAAAIGLVEEGAKLAGILLVAERGFRRSAVFAAAMGVAAGFSSLEALVVLHGEGSALALARVALAPVAHALLIVPLAFGAAAWLKAGRRARAPSAATSAAGRRVDTLRRAGGLAAALAASAALHGAGDLAIALPRVGPFGYAAALAVPALVLFVIAQKRKGPLGWRTLNTNRERSLLGSPAGGRFRV
jgi:hypothetical protein